MSDYSMEINGTIGLSDYSNIFDYLSIIDINDNFIIRINKNNHEDIELINSMLNENRFIVNYTEYDSLGNYCISANKLK